THDERAAGRVARGVVLAARGGARAGAPVVVAHRAAPGVPARPAPVVGPPAVPPGARSRLPPLPVRDPVRRRRTARPPRPRDVPRMVPRRRQPDSGGRAPPVSFAPFSETVEVPTLGKSTAAQRQLRASLRRADAPGGGPRAEGEG